MTKAANAAASLGGVLKRWGRRIVRRRPSRTAYYISIVEPLVDERYYLQRYPHVRELGLSAAEHYVRDGWRRGFDPAPWFSTEGYALINADVAKVNMAPLVHYAIHGRREGRTIMPTGDVRLPGSLAGRAVPEATEVTPVSADLRTLRAREENNWDVHIGAYTQKRLARLMRGNGDGEDHAAPHREDA
ncbi:MAG: hypothetical protein AAGJ94_05790 [Pseudomonadota bacterium]